jgi:UDP-GlcNAc:undecaprenyl-phosphate/decaprenyl-phosphate GlcNAc-1-phosphate transferase
MSTLIPAAVAAIVAAGALFFLYRTGRLPSDRPNDRSLHRTTVPRGGGVAIWLGFLAATVWLSLPQPWLAPLIALLGISILDDIFGMPAAMRLFVQVVAAIGWVLLAGAVPNAGAAVAIVVALVWAANLYNFMDGSDGLTGMMTIVGFSTLALAAFRAGSSQSAVILALAAAAAPFLWANWPPARVFLGDVGSVPLGFMAGVFGLNGWQSGWWPLWFPILVFLPFIADATWTLVARLSRGERPWHAHRDHAYQRLVRLGFGHDGTLALYAALMIGTSLTALAALIRAPAVGTIVLLAWAFVLAALCGGVAYSWSIRANAGANARSNAGAHAFDEGEYNESKC